jgi:hypothetical protein
LGRAEQSKVLNNASVVIEHLLKLQFSPSTNPRAGSGETVVEHRRRLEFDLTPRLRKILADELPRIYALTRRGTDRVLRAHGEHAAADALPATCPYTFDQITGDWWP